MSSHLVRFYAHVDDKIVDTDIFLCDADSLPGLIVEHPEAANRIRADVIMSTPWGDFPVVLLHALPNPALGVGLAAAVQVDDGRAGRAD